MATTRSKGLLYIVFLLAVHASGCIWEGRSGLDPDFFASFGADAGSGSDALTRDGNVALVDAGPFDGGQAGSGPGFVEPPGVDAGSDLDASIESGGDETGPVLDAPVDSGGDEPVEAGSADDAVMIVDAGYPADAASSGGACRNADDRAVFDAVDVDAEVQNCALKCVLEPEIGFCTALCLPAATGLSSACAVCYGQLTACELSNCLDACLNQGADACELCRFVNCAAAFVTCTGLE